MALRYLGGSSGSSDTRVTNLGSVTGAQTWTLTQDNEMLLLALTGSVALTMAGTTPGSLFTIAAAASGADRALTLPGGTVVTILSGTTRTITGYSPDGSILRFFEADQGTSYGCRLTASASQTGIVAASTVQIAFNSELRDDGGFHDNAVNNTRATVPAGKDGWYAISGAIELDNSSGSRITRLKKNGATLIAANAVANATSARMNVNSVEYLAAGDYIELELVNGTGTSATIIGAQYAPILALARCG